MHGEIDAAVAQLLLDFQSEKALAADLRKWTVGDPVALGGDDDDFKILLWQPVGGHKPVARLVRLSERQRAAACADPKRFCLHPPISIFT